MTFSKLRIGDLCSVRIGRTPRRDSPQFWGGSAIWVTVRELSGGVITSSKEQISDLAVREVMQAPIPVGTLLFSFKLSIGKMAIAGAPLYTNEAIAALVILDPNQLDRDYLRFALMATSSESSANHAVLGKVLNKEKVEGIEIPVPPLPEQRRIVDLLSRAEGIVRLRREAEKKAAELIPALFLDMFGDPSTNPKGWAVLPFGDLADNKDGRRKPVKAADRDKRRGSYPYYGASGVIDQIDDYLFDGEHLLIAEDGANLVSRSTPIAFIATGKFWVNNHAHIVSPNGKANLAYLECLLNMRNMKDFITGSAQPKLTQANLNAMSVMVPSIDMQNEFSIHLEAVRSIESQQSAATAKAQATFDSLLARTFA